MNRKNPGKKQQKKQKRKKAAQQPGDGATPSVWARLWPRLIYPATKVAEWWLNSHPLPPWQFPWQCFPEW